MLLGTKKTLYDHIIEALLANEAPVSTIEAYLRAQNVKATIQGVYKALRELIAEDIVVKQKKVYSISNVWREKAGNLFSKKYQFKLTPGEQAVYRFNKIEHLDAFWKHTLNDLWKETGSFPTFDAVPHQFWYYMYGRRESELEYQQSYDKRQVYLFSILGGTTKFDVEHKAQSHTAFHQFSLEEKFFTNRRDNLTVMGSYVVTTKVSAALASNIDEVYASALDEHELEGKLVELFKTPGPMKILIENNKKKAQLLRKRMSSNFYIPKEVREKYKLW